MKICWVLLALTPIWITPYGEYQQMSVDPNPHGWECWFETEAECRYAAAVAYATSIDPEEIYYCEMSLLDPSKMDAAKGEKREPSRLQGSTYSGTDSDVHPNDGTDRATIGDCGRRRGTECEGDLSARGASRSPSPWLCGEGGSGTGCAFRGGKRNQEKGSGGESKGTGPCLWQRRQSRYSMNVNVGTVVASVISGISVLVASGALKFAFDTKDQFATIQNQVSVMRVQLESVQADDEKDESQDRQLSRQWTIVSIHRDWINDLRVQQGKPLVSWPASNWSSRRSGENN